MTEDFDDFYELMGLDEDASQEEIKSAFREKVREYHPDLNDDERAQAQFTALKTAYDTLDNPSERNAYDRMGHEDYVAKRTKGLPSQDVWSDSGSTDSTGTTTSAPSGNRSESSSSSTRSSRGSRTGSSRSERSSRSSGSAGASRSSGSTGSSRSSSDAGTGTAATSGSTTTGSTGTTRTSPSSGTASSAGGGRATASGSATSSYGGTSTATATTESETVGPLGRLLRIKIGWPGIAVANVVYVAGAVLFAIANLASLRSFGSALATAETASISAAALSEPSASFSSYLYGTDYVATTAISGPAAVLVVGAVLLPLVYGVVVKRTRRSSLQWEPTWLYVVCTLCPLAAVGLNLAGYASVGADAALFLLAPLLAILSLPLSAFVRPFVKRVFFG